MINFNKGSVFNLKPIDLNDVRTEVIGMLIPGENMILAFKTIRDQMIFTNKRIIAIDVQGITGTQKSYSSLPYSKIQFFSIQTPSVNELVRDSELFLMFSNGFTAEFEFKGNLDIGAIGRLVAEYVLDNKSL